MENVITRAEMQAKVRHTVSSIELARMGLFTRNSNYRYPETDPLLVPSSQEDLNDTAILYQHSASGNWCAELLIPQDWVRTLGFDKLFMRWESSGPKVGTWTVYASRADVMVCEGSMKEGFKSEIQWMKKEGK